VNSDDVAKCEERFEKAKMVQSILHHIAHHSVEKTGKEYSIEELCKMISWPLFHSHEHAYDVFIRSLRSPEVLDELNLEPKLLELLFEEITKRLKAKPFKFRADIDVRCSMYLILLICSYHAIISYQTDVASMWT
jgi:translation initiation factor 2 subunit 1